MRPRSLLKNPKKLSQMLEERRNGASLLFLARKYKKHHTTIMFHCRKWGIQPIVSVYKYKNKEPEPIEEYIPEIELEPLEQAFLQVEEGPVNRGKSYLEYLEDAMRQKDYAHYFAQYGLDPVKHIHIITGGRIKKRP